MRQTIPQSIVIVGGGFAGTSVARALSTRSHWRSSSAPLRRPIVETSTRRVWSGVSSVKGTSQERAGASRQSPKTET